MRMTTLIAAAAVAGLIGSDQTVAEEADYSPLFSALASHMTLTFICRSELGGMSHYQAARSDALSFSSRLIGEAEAAKGIDDLDKRLRTDPRADQIDLSKINCVEEVNESLYRIRIEKARVTNPR